MKSERPLPRVTIADDELALVLGRLGDSIVAIAYAPCIDAAKSRAAPKRTAKLR